MFGMNCAKGGVLSGSYSYAVLEGPKLFTPPPELTTGVRAVGRWMGALGLALGGAAAFGVC